MHVREAHTQTRQRLPSLRMMAEGLGWGTLLLRDRRRLQMMPRPLPLLAMRVHPPQGLHATLRAPASASSALKLHLPFPACWSPGMALTHVSKDERQFSHYFHVTSYCLT